MELIETEVLVIGSGVAGLSAALELAEKNIEVTIVTRSQDPAQSATQWAQGGIIYRGRGDSARLLTEDILEAGAGHCYLPAVKILAEQGPRLVERILIQKLKTPFDRTTTGRLSLVKEGGHHLPRILHVADATGKAIEHALIAQLSRHKNIRLLTGFTAIDILTLDHHSRNRLSVYEKQRSVGAYLLNTKTNQVHRCLARKTILATGGIGQVFKRTTNPSGARGDGIAMALRAGARVINMEYVQFHPTTFYHEYRPTFLISEAVRGAGARLINADGQLFMEKYNPEWKDLAPRDIVSISIHKEMIERNESNVFLDLHHYIDPEKIPVLFPNIFEQCIQNGIDPREEAIPVVPAAHYSVGGIWVDEFGRTTINDLYAIGEVSCTGVHGANRLASTSLLEGLVWGYRSAQSIARNLVQSPQPVAGDLPPWESKAEYWPDPALISQDLSSIKNIMWNYVGLVRTSYRLQRAIRELRNLEIEIERFYRVSYLTDALVGLRNAVRTAITIASAAWSNNTSQGCHYRE